LGGSKGNLRGKKKGTKLLLGGPRGGSPSQFGGGGMKVEWTKNYRKGKGGCVRMPKRKRKGCKITDSTKGFCKRQPARPKKGQWR